jgi:hypothetical protein
MLLNLPKVLVNATILRELGSNLFLRAAHKNCPRIIDRELANKEKQRGYNVKKRLRNFMMVLKQKSKNINS